MAIANRNKKKETQEKPVPDEKQVEALINKGGSSTKSQVLSSNDDDVVKPIKLNLYGYHHKDIADILAALPKREGISSRHSYVIKALEEKVERDKRKLKLNV